MEMVHGVVPDDMTFTNILCACSHGGLLHEGEMLFHKMIHGYKILPMIQHYGCMVDLFGKAGRLKEAYELIKEMCIDPDATM
ncbi:hypothetical protein GIB67_012161 [Kingdonia uniflora]|uniref:Pentatricopeptide repeat-containing protein n=1 Tax=Kingdonia uniflora TaxID=39325 RepID=A0A7J7NNS3_9MAGN|nr:hypothetical protein GIB67_012161 [Kingdonia uniflora]